MLTASIVQDFYNLVDVYLDAVFFPNCLKDLNTFLQEGWHYELNNPSEDITFKGTSCLRSYSARGLRVWPRITADSITAHMGLPSCQ